MEDLFKKAQKEVKKEDSKIEEVKDYIRGPASRKEAILKEYGGLESNIPVNSPYWRS